MSNIRETKTVMKKISCTQINLWGNYQTLNVLLRKEVKFGLIHSFLQNLVEKQSLILIKSNDNLKTFSPDKINRDKCSQFQNNR